MTPKQMKFGKTLKEKVHKQSYREKMLEKYGPKAFLLPEQKKFPIINPNTGKVSCKMLRAAIARARQHGYEQVAKRASGMFDRKC